MPDKMMPKFSIVMPVHNGENYLASTLMSILNQNYANFAITILENGSTDKTLEIIKGFDDPRITTISSARLLTIEESWARILDLELDEYLCPFAHDDPMFPGYLEEIAALIEAEPEASLYHTGLNVIDGDGRFVKRSFDVPYRESGEQFLNAFHKGRREVIGSGWVMRSEDFKRVGGLPPFCNLHLADVMCYYRLADLSYSVCSPKYLYAYRVHGASEGGKTTLSDLIVAANEYMRALYKTNYGVSPANLQSARDFLRRFLMAVYYGQLVHLLHTDRTKIEGYRKIIKQHRENGFDLFFRPKDTFKQFIVEELIKISSRRKRLILFDMYRRIEDLFIEKSDAWL